MRLHKRDFIVSGTNSTYHPLQDRQGDRMRRPLGNVRRFNKTAHVDSDIPNLHRQKRSGFCIQIAMQIRQLTFLMQRRDVAFFRLSMGVCERSRMRALQEGGKASDKDMNLMQIPDRIIKEEYLCENLAGI